MLIPFEPMKAVQAAAVLLKADGALRASRLRLLTLLYIADRESLQSRARPITGDSVIALNHGPVPEAADAMIAGEHDAAPLWARYVERVGRRDVRLVDDPGIGELTRYEIAKLTEVAERYADADDWAVAEYGQTFPEWIGHKPEKGGRNVIPVEDLLEATGLGGVKDQLLAKAQGDAAAHGILKQAERELARERLGVQ